MEIDRPSSEQVPETGHRVFQTVSDELAQRIRTGDWLPGTRIPSISQLARDLGASTGSVREALRSLESVGLVRIKHGRGVFVADERYHSELDDQFHDDSLGLFVALAEARRLLEPELAALAAERGTAEELAAIDRLARLSEEEAQRGSNFVEPDIMFHRQIVRAAHNPILQSMIDRATTCSCRAGSAWPWSHSPPSGLYATTYSSLRRSAIGILPRLAYSCSST